jgi:hypothetical protein
MKKNDNKIEQKWKKRRNFFSFQNRKGKKHKTTCLYSIKNSKIPPKQHLPN